jgi:hypothetical protein
MIKKALDSNCSSSPATLDRFLTIFTEKVSRELLSFQKLSRGEKGYMKRKIVWGKVKYSCYFSVKTS